MNTTSIFKRVRYRGILQDPNELAWTLSLALPFAFAWYERRQAKGGFIIGPRIVVGAVVAACILCNVMTQSRSGQLSLLAALGVYFVGRFGWRGIAAGAVVAAPLLLFGGRTDESSTEERLDCWAEALDLWREHPVFGAGAKHFTNYHHLTAHNSLLLTLAEMGPIGLVLFTALMYVALKTMLRARQHLTGRPEAAEARSFAFASTAALVGTLVSAFFLSIAYHPALWIALGLAAAVQATVWRHDPQWRLAWGWRDVVAVVGLDVVLVTAIAIYLRLKGH
jgi:O-antigen ligase